MFGVHQWLWAVLDRYLSSCTEQEWISCCIWLRHFSLLLRRFFHDTRMILPLPLMHRWLDRGCTKCLDTVAYHNWWAKSVDVGYMPPLSGWMHYLAGRFTPMPVYPWVLWKGPVVLQYVGGGCLYSWHFQGIVKVAFCWWVWGNR